MARTTITQITDDLDGSRNAEEVAFSFMGVDYTIDLAKKNRAAFEKAMRPYIEAGTRVSRRKSTRAKAKKATTPQAVNLDLKAVRSWGRENGFEVSDRGRVPGALITAYKSAQG